jgi:hypothetical protein
MKSVLRVIASLVVGCGAAVAIAAAGFAVLRAVWPEYAAAEPHKEYTLAMLFSRLTIGGLCTGGAAAVTTIVAGDNGRTAWWLGGLFVVVSLPSHLYYVWNDYPVWYHFLYLAYLVPIAGFSGRLWRAPVENYRVENVPA